MRTSRRLLAVLTVVVAGVGLLLVAPATAERPSRPHVRTAPRAVVHGRVTGSSQSRPTSFDVFSQRSRPTGSVRDAAVGSSARAPSFVSGFDGLADLDGFFPSDTVGALGDNFFVAAVNSSVQVFNQNGTSAVSRTLLETLSGNASIQNFDPKVIYDPYADTFLVAWLGQSDAPQSSHIFTVAIPDATAANTSTWCFTDFAGDQLPASPNLWADYPGLGYNDTRVTITTNQFTFPSATASFRYSQIMTIDKSGLYNCALPPPTPTVFAGTKTRDANGFQSFTIQPAQTVGSSPGAQLLISFQAINGKFDYLVLWRIKPTATGFTLKKACCASTGKVSLPPVGSQGGGGLSNSDFFWDAGDVRLINAFYDADRDELFAAHTVFKNFKPDALTGGYPEAAVQWYEVDPATKFGNSVLARKGVIGSNEVDVGWPTVATDADGTLFVTYNRASDPHGEFLSAWVATIPPGSNNDTQFLLHAGTATYDVVNGVERWGDYTAVNRDPGSPGNMATFNQYASSSSTWQQFISIVTDN
jgi:hypothetical protein